LDIHHIGRYEIMGELGSGGMATVLLGKDSFMDREVAIKLLPRLFMHDPTFKERFQREAKLLAQLEHSAIVPVYDFGYHEEQPYMVNRYMRGGSLLERITEQGALPLDVSLTIVSRICSALSAAHKRGIVHRDIKPANILFDDAGQAFIADFGIAKLAESTSTLTGNTLVGTPAYMSPEQFSGEWEIDGRSDQYSLAIVLFEMLSGEVPFKGDTTAKLMKNHLMDAPPSLRTLRSDLPESVEPVVEEALQKKPADRFPTIEAFHKALAEAVKGEPWMSEAAPAFLPTSKPAEVYQTNVMKEGEEFEKQGEPIKEDVYATNILPPGEPLSLESEKPSETERQSKDKLKGKPKPKEKRKGRPVLRIVGYVLLGIIGIAAIGIGIAWLRDYLYWRNYSVPEEVATQAPEVDNEEEVQPADPPEDELIFSDGDFTIEMEGGGYSAHEIARVYDQNYVIGTLSDWTTSSSNSCVSLTLWSSPKDSDGTEDFAFRLLDICIDGSYSLLEFDKDYEAHVLTEADHYLSDTFDFEMYCYDDLLSYFVYSSAGEIKIYEEIEHPCLDGEHNWGFSVSNDMSIYVDTVEVWQINTTTSDSGDDATSIDPTEPPEEEAPEIGLMLSDGDFFLIEEIGGASTHWIGQAKASDESYVVGTLIWDWIGESDPAFSCVSLGLVSYPKEDDETEDYVTRHLHICADGSYTLIDVDTDGEAYALSEGDFSFGDTFDFEMHCYDDALIYYIVSSTSEIYEEIEHPCWDWEHDWFFSVYNDTSIYVETVEIWK